MWGTDGTACACPKGSACPSPGKHPALARGFLDARRVQDFPPEWQAWAGNWGLALEASGLVALDVDTYKGDGERLKSLETAHGKLPDTLIQRSGSGNAFHYLFKDPGPIRGDIGGITTRRRAYIVIAPSRHKSGNRYEWVTSPSGNVAALPAAWLKLLTVHAPTKTVALVSPDAEPEWLASIPESTRLAECRKMLARESGEEMGITSPGHTFNCLRRAIRASACREPWEAVQEFNARCVPPWDLGRLADKVSQMPSASEPTWGAAFVPPETRVAINWEIALGKPGAAVNGAAPVSHPAPITAPAAALVPGLAELVGKPSSGRVLKFERAADLIARPHPPNRWIVEGILTEESVCVISTEPKSAKTWAATELALAISSPKVPAFGKFTVPKQRAVAYFYAEDVAASIKNRIVALAASRKIDVTKSELYVIPKGSAVNLTSDDDLSALVLAARSIPNLGMIVLDPFRDIHSGKEDSSDDMAGVMRRLRALGVLCSCSVLIVHHSAKATADNKTRRAGQKMRGSSAIQGAIDCGFYMSDLETNGKDRFTNTVEIEIKSARGAGMFSLTLAVEDNDRGEAQKATWTVGEVDREKDLAVTQADYLEILELTARAVNGLSLSQIRRFSKGRYSKIKHVVADLEAEGCLRQIGNGAIANYQITPKGREKLNGKVETVRL